MSTPLGCLFGDALAFLDGVVEIRLSVGMFDPCRPCGYVTGIKAGSQPDGVSVGINLIRL